MGTAYQPYPPGRDPCLQNYVRDVDQNPAPVWESDWYDAGTIAVPAWVFVVVAYGLGIITALLVMHP